MNELSLFSGAGGGLLGTKLLGWKCIGYVEFEKYCQKILRQRIADGILDAAPIFGDIRRFISEGYAEAYQGVVDVITAGFPCQPFSVAGQRKADQDERNMWPATKDCISIIRPQYCFLENVPGLLAHRYVQRIFGDLAELGYNTRWGVIGANSFGAPHQRERLWIVAYTPNERWTFSEDKKNCTDKRECYPNPFKSISGWKRETGGCIVVRRWKALKTGVGRINDGLADPMDRLKAIGNGQVPIVAATAWRILTS